MKETYAYKLEEQASICYIKIEFQKSAENQTRDF